MILKLSLIIVLAFARRLWGGLWEEIFKNKISRTYMLVLLIPYISFALGNNIIAWFTSIWISIFFALSMNNYWDFGIQPARKKQELDYLLEKLFNKELWNTCIYDYTGMILHFTLCSLPLMIYSKYSICNGIVIPVAYAIFMNKGKSEIAEFIFGASIAIFLII